MSTGIDNGMHNGSNHGGDIDRNARRDRWQLAAALGALGALYFVWFRDDRHAVAAWCVFAGPPLLLALWTAVGGSPRSRFLAGVFGLFWFSHGVMTAWADATHRAYALGAVALAVAIIFVANAAGLRAKLLRRR